MANNVACDFDDEQELNPSVVARWPHLFGYTSVEAESRIRQQRSNFTKERVADDLWDMARNIKEASGYDREAYEHELENERTKLQRSAERAGPSVSQASSESTYILKLEGPLNTPTKIQEAAALPETPAITTGSVELGDASFVTIDTAAKDAITT